MLVIGTDSFVSLLEAESIMIDNFLDTENELVVWNKLQDKNKEILLKRATVVLNKLNYIGQRDTTANKLKFPRFIKGVKCIPDEIKTGTVIQAIKGYCLTQDDNYKNIKSGIDTLKVAENSISYKNVNVDSSNVFNEVYDIISKYIISSINT